MFWRKVSLYTTAFVVLDIPAGPPVLMELTDANFPWPLDTGSWRFDSWWPITSAQLCFVMRGVAYYWWMTVLTLTLWRRLRRRWGLILILLLMPFVTMASCRVGYYASEAADDIIRLF